MKRSAMQSLGSRLSIGLALQTFAGLAMVSTLVYLAISWDLRDRRVDSLVHKRELVEHVLEEVRQDGDIAELRHKLDDFFMGHPDMALRLTRSDGSRLYDNLGRMTFSARDETLDFSSRDWSSSGSKRQVQMRLSTRGDDLFLRRIGIILLTASLAGALAVSVTGALLVRRSLKPIHLLVDQVRRLGAARLHDRLDGASQASELRPLVDQFNALMGRLEQAYDQLEGFNADVAHELQTPLATLTTSIELGLMNGRYPSEVADLLGSNLEELRRLTGIVRDMLFLSHADRGEQAQRIETHSLADLARTVGEYHEAALADAGIRFRIVGDAVAAVDAGLVKRALSNLIGNATRYAHRGTEVIVEIGSSDECTTVVVINHGVAMDSTQLSRLFDRFFRGDRARSRGESGHHGLGLSIVAAIARMHGGSVLAESHLDTTRIGFRIPRPPDGAGVTARAGLPK